MRLGKTFRQGSWLILSTADRLINKAFGTVLVGIKHGLCPVAHNQNKNQSSPTPFIFLISILLFCAASTVNAASFDCTKAASHVEKLICSNSEISELDDEVNIDYHKTLDETNNGLRTDLIKQQKHWLKFMRNRCSDELCLKHAYWSKLAELETFFIVNNLNIHGPTYIKSPYKNEAEKLEPIKQILATTKMHAASSQPAFCQQIFDDIKQMRNISFLEAKVKTSSYEDAALDPWKQHCKSGQSLNFGYMLMAN
jgi:uncharacterized protein